MATAVLALGGTVWLALGQGVGGARVSAQLGEAGSAPGALEGFVVGEGDLPRDANGQPVLDGIPGARQRQPLPADIRARLAELTAAHRQAKGVLPRRVAPVPAGPLPGDASAPPRMDGGDPNPDRSSIAAPQPAAP